MWSACCPASSTDLSGVQVLDEWGKARQDAAAAKSAGNKDGQKAAGMRIRDLKQEMAGVGALLTGSLGWLSASVLQQAAARLHRCPFAAAESLSGKAACTPSTSSRKEVVPVLICLSDPDNRS